jgi:hypothetical protein
MSIFKSLERQCDKVEHYFPLYEQWFNRFIGTSPKILEIGVQYGGSSEMWRKYFGKGTVIHGVDIDPRCHSLENDYLTIHIGDQGSTEFWNREFIGNNIDSFDIIIDDGSHENRDQICSLSIVYDKLLKIGGLYWCEDTHTSYYNEVRVSDGGYKNEKSFIEYTKKIIDAIHSRHTRYAIGVGNTPDAPHIPKIFTDIYRTCPGIHYYDSVVVIEKSMPVDFSRVISIPGYGVKNIELLPP